MISLAGFGISPGIIKAENILRNSSFEKIFVLSRSDPVNDLLISVEAEGETADWFSFERGSRFTYPAGNKQFPIKATVKVPKGTPNGTYMGGVRFTGLPQASCDGDDCEGTSVSVALGALADIEISVTDKEIKSFRVLGVQIDKARETEPIVFSLFLENTGNVQIQPGYIIVDLFDKFHKIQLGSFTVSKFQGFAPVQRSGRVLATVPYASEAGNLWAEVSIFDHENKLVAKENLPFDVTTKDGSPSDSETSTDKTNKNNLLFVIMGALAGALLFSFFGFVFFARYLKKLSRPEFSQKKGEVKQKNNQLEGFVKPEQENLPDLSIKFPKNNKKRKYKSFKEILTKKKKI